MESSLQLHEFFVEGGDPQKSHVLITITEPATDKEREKGYFFAVCEANQLEERVLERLQEVIDEIENGYYEIPDSEDKTSLELILEKVNREAFSLAKPENSLHAVVGAIRWPEILLSFHGNPKALLFYKNKDGEYSKMNLLSGEEADEGDGGRQFFSQLIQGKVSERDFFFFSTPNLINFFSEDRIQKIITTRPPRQSSEHFERVLKELKNDLSFGGIILSGQTQSIKNFLKKTRPLKQENSAHSLRKLFSTEQQTASILSSSLFPKIQSRLAGSMKRAEANATAAATEEKISYRRAKIDAEHLKTRRHQETPAAASLVWQNRLIKTGALIWRGIRLLARFIAWVTIIIAELVISLGRNFALLCIVAINYQNRRQLILNSWRAAWRSRQEYLRHLPLATKILTVSVIVILIAFITSISVLEARQKRAAEELAYQNTLQTIKVKRDNAESALIYRDNSLAMQELQGAHASLAALPCRTEEQKNNCASLQNEIEAMLGRVRKLITNRAELLFDWSGSGQNMAVQKIVKINNKILGLSATSSKIISYDLLTKQASILDAPAGVSGFVVGAAPKENDYAILLSNERVFVKYDPKENTLARIEVGFPREKTGIRDIVVYNRRLYSLDAQNNQIYKHDAIRGGFDRGKEWVKDANVNVREAVGFTIEGDVYAIRQNGTVVKLSKGAAESFSIQGLDPALQNGEQIWSYTDLSFIYILDSANKRIVILEKTGDLKSQITSNEFSAPSGMVVEEGRQTAYVADDNKLYKISLK